MSAATGLYDAIMLRHGRNSPFEREIAAPRLHGRGVNPRCGDEIDLYLRVEDGVVAEASFTGEGCLLSRAAASLLCDAVTGKTLGAALAVGDGIRGLLRGAGEESCAIEGELRALSAVAPHAARHRCVTLCCSALENALQGE